MSRSRGSDSWVGCRYVQVSVCAGVFYETLKPIKQKHGQSLALPAVLLR